MIGWINDKHYWQPALDTDGKERDDAGVINATQVIPLDDYLPVCSLRSGHGQAASRSVPA